MPWKETCLMDEKVKFVGYYLKKEWSFSMLCREFGISRTTGYKYINRYHTSGLYGLKEISRAPHNHPNAVSLEIEEVILSLRSVHPTWGPRKLRAWLQSHHPRINYPASSTIGDILRRHGLTVPRRRVGRTPPYTEPFTGCTSPNDVWCADFKGWFLTGDNCRCNPLTISDAASRFLIRCQTVDRPDFVHVKPIFEAAFLEHGLPLAIRTDNGVPFATTTLGGLSRLSIWWIKLGIVPERIEPGHPEQNGRHERMHRTLKQDTATPPKSTLRTQQNAFDHFREEYNYQRPHEALDQTPPAKSYCHSLKPYPLITPQIKYPDYMKIRKIHHQGDLKWRGRHIYLSETLAREYVGLKQIDDQFYEIYFDHIKLAKLDDYNSKIIRPSNTKKRLKKNND
jgi:transposase InsO family protein